MQTSTTTAPPSEDLVRAIFPGAEIRSEESSPPTMFGHFTRTGEWARIDSVYEGTFMERVAAGAIAESLASHTPKVLFQHGRDPQVGDKVLGVPTNVREDEVGGAYEVPLFDTAYNRELIPGLEVGAYGVSYRFNVQDEEVERAPERSDHNPDGLPERTITRMKIAEFGPVTFPAFAGPSAGIRSMTDTFRSPRVEDTIAELARHQPGRLAQMIERAIKGATPPAEDEPRPGAPTRDVPPERTFRSREEFLQWMVSRT